MAVAAGLERVGSQVRQEVGPCAPSAGPHCLNYAAAQWKTAPGTSAAEERGDLGRRLWGPPIPLGIEALGIRQGLSQATRLTWRQDRGQQHTTGNSLAFLFRGLSGRTGERMDRRRDARAVVLCGSGQGTAPL